MIIKNWFLQTVLKFIMRLSSGMFFLKTCTPKNWNYKRNELLVNIYLFCDLKMTSNIDMAPRHQV